MQDTSELTSPEKEYEMDKCMETTRGVLAAMKYSPERIEAALVALEGRPEVIRSAEPLLTPRQLSERLGISITSLWRLQPPYIRVGGRKRYEWSEVERFLTGHKGNNEEV